MAHLIAPIELMSMLEDPGVVVFDCRFDLQQPEAGSELFAESHLPKAQYLDLNRHLSSDPIPGVTGRHPLPDPLVLRQTLGQLGVGPDSSVVAYDQGTGAYASRLWWLLRWLGHPKVQVLNGGYAAWCDAKGPLTQTVDDFQPQTLPERPAMTRQVAADELNPLQPQRKLIDVRDPVRFRGEQEPIDLVAGHIPSAHNLPFLENLSGDRFKSKTSLLTMFQQRGLQLQDDVVCYCGSGVTATQMILALLEAGFNEPALYPGSWSEWITHPDRPIALGAEHH